MSRTMLIVPSDDRPIDVWVDLAQREGAGEIVRGVPPALTDALAGVLLPYLYVEPDPDPVPETPTPEPEFASAAWAEAAQAELAAQRRILDLLLLGGLEDGGTIDGAIGDDLPDTGGSLDDLDGLEGIDWTPLPDSGETLDDLEGLT